MRPHEFKDAEERRMDRLDAAPTREDLERERKRDHAGLPFPPQNSPNHNVDDSDGGDGELQHD